MRPVAYLYPEERKYLSLDGEWLFQEDPIRIGEKECWFRPELKRIFRRTTKVPLPWQAQFPDLADYSGVAWYAKVFLVPQGATFTKALLDFTAIDHAAMVWINGVYVGHHEGGYSRFAFEVSDCLRRGEENYLVIRVFDPRNNMSIPHGKQGGGWYQQVSGIWGSVYLEFLRDSIVISDGVIFPRSTEGDVEIQIQVKRLTGKGNDKAFVIRCEVDDGEIQSVLLNDIPIILPGKTILRSYYFSAKIEQPRLWTPQTPQLYKGKFTLREVPNEAKKSEDLTVDTFTLEFGLRVISTIKRQLYLNGHPIIIRGVLDQGYNPSTLYTPPSEEFMKSEINAVKNLGMNLIRKHIKVEDPRYIYWCDHLGMLYWAEPPNIMVPSPTAIALFQETLLNMIIRDRNHPCIIIWGIFNEEWGIWGAWFGIWNRLLRHLYARSKLLDSTRLVVDNSGWAHVQTDINDYHHYFMAPDSEYFWTRQLRAIKRFPQWNFNRSRGTHPTTLPQVISEYGCGGLSDLTWMGPITEGSEPYWYLHNGKKNEIEGFVFPNQFTRRFYQVGVNKIFSSFKEFTEKSQWREFTSNKFITEEIRRANLAGYILTELADIEWEYNGLLQYDRSAKVFNAHYSVFNSEDILIIRPNKRIYQAGETIQVKFYLSLFSNTNGETATLRWQIPALHITGEAGVFLRKYHSHVLHEITIDLPQTCPSLLNTPINTQLITPSGNILAQNFEPISVIPVQVIPNAQSAISIQIYDPDRRFRQNISKWSARGLNAQNVLSGDAWNVNVPLIAIKYDKWVKMFVKTGGKVLYSAEMRLPPKKKRLSIRKTGLIHLDAPRTVLPKYISAKKIPGLPVVIKPYFRGESWDGMFSLLFADPKIYHPLLFQNPLNWESVNIWPDQRLKVMRKTTQMKILAGTVFGWANVIYPLILKIRVGPGTVILSTFNLLRNYLDDPIATIVCYNLILELNKGD